MTELQVANRLHSAETDLNAVGWLAATLQGTGPVVFPWQCDGVFLARYPSGIACNSSIVELHLATL